MRRPSHSCPAKASRAVRGELALTPPVTACPPATAPCGVANASGASAGEALLWQVQLLPSPSGTGHPVAALPVTHRAQADALEIEAQAKRRLADEYDAAQHRGEVQPHGGQGKRDVPAGNIPTVADLGLTRKAIHEARQLRDAEEASPGVIRPAHTLGWWR